MNAIKEKMSQNKNALIIIISTVVLVVIIGILLGKGVANAPEVVDDQISGAFNSQDLASDSDTELSADNLTKIRYPVLSNPDLFDYSGKVTSCGEEIAWVTAKVPTPKSILNTTFKAMFTDKTDLGFKPGNFVANQKDLKFDSGKIEGSVATIYLSGKLNSKNKCDLSRLTTQINEAALQFGNVKSVQIFLNDKLLQ